MVKINLIESCKGFSSLIRNRVKRKDEPPTFVFPNDSDYDILPVQPDSSLLHSNDLEPTPSQPTSSSRLHHQHLDPSSQADCMTSSCSSVLSSGTRSTLNNLYELWAHEQKGDEDEDEPQPSETDDSETTKTNAELTSPLDEEVLFRVTRLESSTSTLCTLNSGLTGSEPREVKKRASYSSTSTSSSSRSEEDEDDEKLSDLKSNLASRTQDRRKRGLRSLYKQSKPCACPFPSEISKKPIISGPKRQLKRVKPIHDLKRIQDIEPWHETKEVIPRQRRTGMIGCPNLTELNSRINAITLPRKISEPMLRLKISWSSLNGTLPSTFFSIPSTEYGLHASNFVEVLEYEAPRGIDAQDPSFGHSHPISSSRKDLNSVKRVRFLEPSPVECLDSGDGSSETSGLNEVQEMMSTRSRLSSYVQRKKEDWSTKLFGQSFATELISKNRIGC